MNFQAFALSMGWFLGIAAVIRSIIVSKNQFDRIWTDKGVMALWPHRAAFLLCGLSFCFAALLS